MVSSPTRFDFAIDKYLDTQWSPVHPVTSSLRSRLVAREAAAGFRADREIGVDRVLVDCRGTTTEARRTTASNEQHDERAEEAPRRRDDTEKGALMTQEFNKGDRVTWSSHGGSTEGEVIRKITSDTELAGRQVRASEDEPQYLVRSEKSGGEAVHKPSALTKKG
jgi:hypothetical protein